jgi:hypothetical protein
MRDVPLMPGFKVRDVRVQATRECNCWISAAKEVVKRGRQATLAALFDAQDCRWSKRCFQVMNVGRPARRDFRNVVREKKFKRV